ncbi:MAG: Gfo/Idh/MocA family oxidoreductase [Syntrophales bacterium]|nr:Gfo/Idh/MocA family oxidoreductase [Syntrophales bacterium]
MQNDKIQRSSIAVIGAGYWGKNLVRNFYQLGVLKAVCDADGKIRKQIKNEYPEVRIVAKEEEIFDDPSIDAVVIAAPAVAHYSLAREVLSAGKHVFVEKPLSLNYEDGRKLVDLAHEKGKALFVGHILHYHAAVVKLKEMIRAGQIGRLQYIYSRRLSLGKIRREENILWSFAPHDISLILGIVGEDPNYIDAVGNNFLHAQIPDVTMTNLKFPSGIGAHIFVSWLNPFKEQRLVVIGSMGMLVFDDTQPIDEKLILYPHTINWKNCVPTPEKAEGEAIGLSDQWDEPLKAECKAFLEAIVTGQSPLTDGEEGLHVLKILESCQKSIEQKESAIPHSSSRTSHLFVHGAAVIDKDVEIGKGTKVWHFSHVLSGSKIGEDCNIGQNVMIGPDVTVGNSCKIQNNVSVYPEITLEDGVFCGPSVVFTNVYNPRAEIRKMDRARPTLVKRGAIIGANATVVCGYTLGCYSFVGAGAVVTKDVPDYALVVGNPARQTGWVCQCGEKLDKQFLCPVCRKQYKKSKNGVVSN